MILTAVVGFLTLHSGRSYQPGTTSATHRRNFGIVARPIGVVKSAERLLKSSFVFSAHAIVCGQLWPILTNHCKAGKILKIES